MHKVTERAMECIDEECYLTVSPPLMAFDQDTDLRATLTEGCSAVLMLDNITRDVYPGPDEVEYRRVIS